MCVTVSATTSDLLAQGLLIERDNIYSEYISDEASSALPNFDKWVTTNEYTADVESNVLVFQSLGGAC